MSLFGTVELGGTKTLVSVGTTPDDLAAPYRIPTGDPETTLSAVFNQLEKHTLDAVGLATFGPVELRRGNPRFGCLLNTPKPGWSGYPLYQYFTEALAIPVGIDTDVKAAALGEGTWGAGRGLDGFAYMTVGTGIGCGVVANDQMIGTVGHPEVGHIAVERLCGDTYPGVCPAHQDCLEGMASGAALADRFGSVDSRGDGQAALKTATFYVAQGLRSLIYTVAPQRIIVGGGVSKMAGFHEQLRLALAKTLGGYPGLVEYSQDQFVVAPGLGEYSGLAGGLVIASQVST